MARKEIKKKPAPKVKGDKPAGVAPPKQTWKPTHPMAGQSPTPARQQSQKRGKR